MCCQGILYYYTKVNSSVICCLSSGDIYLFFGTFLSLLALSFSNFLNDILETHTSMTWNSELNIFNRMKFVGGNSSKLPNGLFGTNVYKTVESRW